MRVILINVSAGKEALYALSAQKGPPAGASLLLQDGGSSSGKWQIADTKNPGLSTRVFAIDSKSPTASS
jgi:hypothetical protein